MKRLVVYGIETLIGAGALMAAKTGFLTEEWRGFGLALLILGALRLLKALRYHMDADYREKTDIEAQDERNKYIANKAWAWAGYWFVILMAVTIIVLFVTGRGTLCMMASGAVCLLMVLYWLNYLVLSKKY